MLGGFNFAPFCEALQVRKSEFLTKRLDNHGSVATDMFISNKLAWGNVKVNCELVDGKVVGYISTRASDEKGYSTI